MNEEEKKAIEYLKARLYGNEGCYLIDVAQSDLRIFLNLVDKQQKVIDEMAKQLVDLPIPISQEENVLFFNSFDVKKFFYKKIEKK